MQQAKAAGRLRLGASHRFATLFGKLLRALSTLRGLRGAPEVPPLCRETQSLGQQMLTLKPLRVDSALIYI